MHPLFHSGLGQVMLVIAILMVVAGSYIIGKLIEIRA